MVTEVRKMNDLLRIDNIEKYYGTRSSLTKALDGLSFSVAKKEFVAIMGASGSGKTTLLNCISTIDKVTSGHIFLGDTDITKLKGEDLNSFRREELGFIFQDFNLLDTLTGYENIALALSIQNVPFLSIDSRIKKVAKELDITNILNKYPYEMSGGQKQRVAIAGIIAMEPSCIVLDEPTAMLDPRGRQEVMDTITKLNRERGITIVLITHYMDEAVKADRVIVMDDGKILTEGTPKEVFSQVDLIKEHSLDVPQATEICYELQKAGVNIKELPLDEESCFDVLMEVLK